MKREELLEKVKTLYQRTTNPGEKAAAYEALKRLGITDVSSFDKPKTVETPKTKIKYPNYNRPGPPPKSSLKDSELICIFLNKMGHGASQFSPSFTTYKIGPYKLVVDTFTDTGWKLYRSSLDFLSDTTMASGKTLAQFQNTYKNL